MLKIYMDKEDTQNIIKDLHTIFKNNNLTLSVAESCTGGLISHYITTLPGASKFFEAGIVSYSAKAKKNILGIPDDIISRYGVVSEETAREMAKRIRYLTKTDFSISTTGNLGPETLENKEKGLIYIAVSSSKDTFSKTLRLKGNREENKDEAAIISLKFLIEIINNILQIKT